MYPDALRYFVNKISNFSTNTVKLLPYRTDGITAGQILVVDLPQNSLCDLRTLAWHFDATTTASGGTSNFARFPQNAESCIDRINIEINGQSLVSANNTNLIYNLLLPVSGGTDLKNKRSVYAGAGDQTNPTANITNEKFVVQHFLGFLGSCKPDVLDTSLLGNVRITIQLANANILIKASPDGPTAASYTLNNTYFTLDTISIDDGTFYPLHQQFLSSGGVYEIPFDSYYTSLFSSSTMNQSSRFSLSTGSLDWIMGSFPSAYNTLSAVNSASGRGEQFDTVLTGLETYKFTVNNIQYPQYTASIDDTFALAMNGLNLTSDPANGISPKINQSTWKSSFGFALQKFNLDADSSERCLSGINSLGTNMVLSFETTGATSVGYAFIIAKCTSVLRVGAGRSLEMIL